MSARLREALLGVSEKELREYFTTTFETPIVIQLKGGSEPAENLRTQIKQTEKILNCLLTLRGK